MGDKLDSLQKEMPVEGEGMKGLYVMYKEYFDRVYTSRQRERVEAQLEIKAPVKAPEEIAAQPEVLEDVQVVFGGWGMPVLNKSLLQRAPVLEAIFYGAGSVKSFVTEAFWEQGIRLSSAAEANAVPVMEYTHAMVYLLLKQVFRQERQARQDRVFEQDLALHGGYRSTVGLLGLSTIGEGVARRLKDSDLQVRAYDPMWTPEQAATLGVEWVSLETLFAESSVVSVHAPLLEETRHLIDADLLHRMPENGGFLNTARGGIVNEADLIRVARQRDDLQFVLDVTDPEPPQTDSPLYDLPNVFLTPHIAGSIGPECERLGAFAVDEFERYQRGESLQGEVGLEQWGYMA